MTAINEKPRDDTHPARVDLRDPSGWWHGEVEVTEVGLLVTKTRLICTATGRALILRRSAQARNRVGKWDAPGGFIRPGEDVIDGTKREILEETGKEVLSVTELGRRLVYSEEGLPLDMRLHTGEVLSEEPVELNEIEHDLYLWDELEIVRAMLGSALVKVSN